MEFVLAAVFVCVTKTHRQIVSVSAVNLLRQKRKKRTLAETLNFSYFLRHVFFSVITRFLIA